MSANLIAEQMVANGAAKVQNIKPGISDHGVTAVEGVNPGDQLATSSFEKLQNGSKVERRKPAPAQGEAATKGSG